MQLTGREKATIFLSILGPETSSRILRYLPEELADLIASSVNHLPTPTPEALGEVLNDFRSYGALPAYSHEVEAEEPKIITEDMSPREVIENLPASALAFVLSDERPQIIAFMLTLLPERKREDVLSAMVSQKGAIQEQLESIKKSAMAPSLEEKLVKYFAGKLR